MSTASFKQVGLPAMATLLSAALATLGILACATQSGCARPPAREVVKLDQSVPVGRVEGKDFQGVRLPMSISANGTAWVIDTKYPRFLLDQGYEEEGLESSDLFVYNPNTQSSLQISFSPADAYTRFSQETIEYLTNLGAGGVESELNKQFGKGNYTVSYGTVEPYSLKGVPYAARNFIRYTSGDIRRENGWIYAFAEPFQMFFIYLVNDPEKNPSDRQEMEKVLSTFQYHGFQ